MSYEKKKLKDCCVSISDGDHQPPPKAEAGIPFITISNINSNNQLDFSDVMYVPEDYYDSLPSNKKASVGDILYSVVGSFGKPVYISNDDKFVFQRHIAILKPTDEMDGKYLYYTMLNPMFYRMADKLAIGCAQRTITLDSLRNIIVDIPPIEKQKKISDVLNAIDGKIAVNNRINDNLQQQLRLLYDYWFTQFDFPDENGKPYRSSGGQMVWNYQLKKYIPKSWHCALLRDVLKQTGTGINNVKGKEHLFYTPVDIIPQRTISFAGGLDALKANSSLQLYEKDDILLGAMRVYFHRVCIAAQNGITRTTTMILKPVNGENYLGYAYSVLNDDRTILYANQNSSGTQQPYINWNDALEKYPFAAPDDQNLMLKYSQLVRPLIKEAQTRSLENCQLQKLRDWLLPMLMNGQATISD